MFNDRSTWIEKKFKIYKPGELIDKINRVYDVNSYIKAMKDERVQELIKSKSFYLTTRDYIKSICNESVKNIRRLSLEPGKEIGIVTDWKIGEITTKVDPKYADDRFEYAKHYMIAQPLKDDDTKIETIYNIKLIFFYI